MGLLDNIPPLLKASSTSCTLAATHNGQPTRITIGGKQYKLSAQLQLVTSNPNGLGGLDTGALGSAYQLYYVYACANTSGVVGLVASQTAPSTGPSGFSARYKLIGAFYVSNTAAIASTVTTEGEANSEYFAFTPTGLMTTNTTYFGLWKRKGDHIFIRAILNWAGAPNAVDGTVDLPFGVLDVAKTNSNGIRCFGTGTLHDNSPSSNYVIQAVWRGTTSVFLIHSTGDTGNGGIIRESEPIIIASGDSIDIEFSVPLVGWGKTLLG